MKQQSTSTLSKNRSRGFESLEPRYALDATATTPQIPLALPATPGPAPLLASTAAATTAQALPLMAVRVYSTPIGPQPATVSATPLTGSTLPPLTLSAFQRLGSTTALPIGPARPATLPTPTPPLFADGYLPTNQTPANLPTERQTMPVVTDPPGPPTFTLTPIRPLH